VAARPQTSNYTSFFPCPGESSLTTLRASRFSSVTFPVRGHGLPRAFCRTCCVSRPDLHQSDLKCFRLLHLTLGCVTETRMIAPTLSFQTTHHHLGRQKARLSMPNRRGNPIRQEPVYLWLFHHLAAHLSIWYPCSAFRQRLRELDCAKENWVRKNKKHRYVRSDLLQTCVDSRWTAERKRRWGPPVLEIAPVGMIATRVIRGSPSSATQ
jgi:hypothetical protein